MLLRAGTSDMTWQDSVRVWTLCDPAVGVGAGRGLEGAGLVEGDAE